LGHQAHQIPENRLGLLFRHLMGFREICGEMLQGHGRLCGRFLRCHDWPSSLESGPRGHPSQCRLRRFGYGLTMTYWRKMWAFSMPMARNRPTTGLGGVPGVPEGANLPVGMGFSGCRQRQPIAPLTATPCYLDLAQVGL